MKYIRYFKESENGDASRFLSGELWKEIEISGTQNFNIFHIMKDGISDSVESYPPSESEKKRINHIINHMSNDCIIACDDNRILISNKKNNKSIDLYFLEDEYFIVFAMQNIFNYSKLSRLFNKNLSKSNYGRNHIERKWYYIDGYDGLEDLLEKVLK